MNFIDLFSYSKLKSYYQLIKHKTNLYAEKQYRIKCRKRIENKDFTIISNNCWGGGVYETLALAYKTPTVGLFFFSECYIKFLQNLKENLEKELRFINVSKYEKGNQLRTTSCYPIGMIGDDIEIHFLHYKSEEEALEKWNRRKIRVDFDNLFVSFTDNEAYTIEQLMIFDNLPFRKVFFSSKKITGIKSLVWLKMFQNKSHIGDIYTYPRFYWKYFDVVKWLNSK